MRGRCTGRRISRRLSGKGRGLIEMDAGSGSPLLVGDGEQLPLRSDGFDAVVSIDALEWTPDPVALLRESARVCKPDGRVVAVHTRRAGAD